jgi:hypothetical protein
MKILMLANVVRDRFVWLLLAVTLVSGWRAPH